MKMQVANPIPGFSDAFHVDAVNLLVVAAGGIWYWYKVLRSKQRKDDHFGDMLTSQRKWNEDHQLECDESRRSLNDILIALRESNARLTTLAESHHDRLDRIEDRLDRRVVAGG